MPKPLNFIVPLVIYPFDVMVSVDQTDEQLMKILRKHGEDEQSCEKLLNQPDTCPGRAVLLASNRTVIRLRRQRSKAKFAGIIAHEVFHAVTFIFDRIGITFDLDKCDEAYAYAIMYLAEKIHEKALH